MTLLSGKAARAAILVVFCSVVAAGQTSKLQTVNLQTQDSNSGLLQETILSTPGAVTLHWTAPGDDGNVGTANHYVVKYSTANITESNWAAATTIANPPAPLPAGTSQSFAITGLPRGTQYYFAIKTYDEANNVSALSNIRRIFTGGIVTPTPRPAIVDSLQAAVLLQADTVVAAKRDLYQFALDTSSAFPTASLAVDSLIESPAHVLYTNLRRDETFYWRVRVIFTDQTDTSLWSATGSFYMPAAPLPPPPPPPDSLQLLSVGMPVAVSGTFSGYTTAVINDGAIAPRGGTASTWASLQDATIPQWVEITFPTAQVVQRARVYWAWNAHQLSWMCSRQYQIQYWNASTASYQTITTVNNATADSVTSTDFAPVTTTRIRYYQPANMGPSNYASILWLTELQYFGSDIGDNVPPVISSISAGSITGSSAIISWNSNEAATSQVDYGVTTSYGASTPLDGTLVSAHSQALSGLASSATYHYRVRSRDAAGNETVSGDNTFVTTSAVQLLSAGMPVAVSGTFSGYSTVPINDGTIAPRGGTASTWASLQDATIPQWVEITFPSAMAVQRLRIYWAWNSYRASWMCSRQYQIQYWDAASSSYLAVTTVNNAASDSVSTTDFAPVTTTKMRYYQPANMGPTGYSAILWFTELQYFGSDVPGLLSMNRDDYSQTTDSVAAPLALISGSSALPQDYFLSQSYPNPFNAVTNIDYGLPADSHVTFEIYDVTGRLVTTLLDEYQTAGYHRVTWNSSGNPSGTYLYRIEAGSFSQTKKMAVVK